MEAAPSMVPGFFLGERIGAGGFGEVYRARHVLMDREVAIKILNASYSADAEAVSRFIAEARAVARISHPSIVDIFDFGVLPDGRHYCAMELIRGRTLREVLGEHERLPLDRALPVLRRIAEAIDAAHAAGVAHRDLKPDNVFVLDGDQVKLIDFGLAKLAGDDTTVTKTGSVFGTPLYMSPEQCRGRASDLRTDAYSFGVLAYRTLTGTTPFTGDALELALHHLNDPPPPPTEHVAELGERVDRVVLALLAKDPAQRPMPLVSAVDSITEGTLPPRPRTRSRRSWIAGGIAVVALGGVAYVATRGSNEPVIVASDCPTAASKLAGAWDPFVRARGQARYAAAHGLEVDTAWRVGSQMFDDYAARWGSQWDAACSSPDRDGDRLLYAQRLTCLDNALVAFHGVTASMIEGDPALFSAGFIGTPFLSVLEDCERVSVLRAQPPAPPAGKRDVIVRTLIDVQRARNDVRTGLNAQRPEMTDGAFDRLGVAAKFLDGLDVPDAAIAWFWIAYYTSAAEQSKWATEHRAEATNAVKRIRELRNEQVLVDALAARLRNQLYGGATDAELDHSVVDLADAVERAGKPLRGQVALLEQRAQVAMARHQIDKAIPDLEAAARIAADHPGVDTLSRGRFVLARAYARGERLDAALALERTEVRALEIRWGADYFLTRQERLLLARLELQAGNLRAARSGIDAALATIRRTRRGERDLQLHEGLAVVLAYLDGDRAGAEAEAAASANPTSAYLAASDVALGWAESGALNWTFDHLRISKLSADQQHIAWFQRAYVAFMVGDLPAMRAASTHIPDDWPAIVIDALEGHPDRSRAAFARWKHQAGEGGWVLGVIERAAGGWKAAEAAFTQPTPSGQSDLDAAEIAADLGAARVELGQWQAAIPVLEKAIDIGLDVNANGRAYSLPFARFALARALWETAGDKGRARRLAEQARDGFARLGTGRDKERERATRWLADHSIK